MSLLDPIPSLISGPSGSSILQGNSGLIISDDGPNGNIIAQINNNEAFRVDNNLRVGIGTDVIDLKRLEINDPIGDNLRLIYNDNTGSPLYYTDFCLEPNGNLLIKSSGTDIKIHTNNSFDIVGHDNSTKGLKLNGILITASSNELNYNDITTIGVAEPGKTLVLDNNSDITGINNLTVNNFSATTFTATGLLNNFAENSLIVNSFSGDNMNGKMIKQELITDINLTNYDPLGQTDTYSIEVIGFIKPQYSETYTFYITSNDGDRLWVNNILLHNNWIGNATDEASITIPLIAERWYPIRIHNHDTSGVQQLLIQWESVTQTKANIPLSRMAWDNTQFVPILTEPYVANSISIYDTTTDLLNIASLSINLSGELNINSQSDNINIVGHNGSTVGLKLGGTLVTSTAIQLNYTNITTTGIAEANKALILDSNKNITNINELTVTTNCISIEDNTNNILYPLKLTHSTTITPNNNIGVGLTFNLENSSNIITTFGSIDISANNITENIENGKLSYKLIKNGTLTEVASINEIGEMSCTRVIETSDIRLKENIVKSNLLDSFNKIKQIQIKDYNFIGENRPQRGVIAQELKKIIPNAIHIMKSDKINDLHKISNSELLSHLIASVQYIIEKLNL